MEKMEKVEKAVSATTALVKGVQKNLSQLEKVVDLLSTQDRISALPTPQLVQGYAATKALEKQIRTFNEMVKDEVLRTVEMVAPGTKVWYKGQKAVTVSTVRDGVEPVTGRPIRVVDIQVLDTGEKVESVNVKLLYQGRFFEDPTVTVDDKGHLWMSDGEGTYLQAQRRVTSVFDEEAARAVLGDLVKEAEEVTGYQVTDMEHFMGQFNRITRAVDRLLEITEDPKSETFELAMEILRAANAIQSLIEAKTELSEEKIRALVTLGKIQPSDVAKMFVEKETFALYVKEAKKGK